MTIEMTPSRPYLLRAYYDWLLDNDLTPHLLVNTLEFGVEVPQEFVQNDQIVLNIEPSAVAAFHMDLSAVSFNARFGGVPRDIHIPMSAILAIYARETGAGSAFEPEPSYESAAKDNIEPAKEAPKSAGRGLGVVAGRHKTADKTSIEDLGKSVSKPAKKKPSLRVIK